MKGRTGGLDFGGFLEIGLVGKSFFDGCDDGAALPGLRKF